MAVLQQIKEAVGRDTMSALPPEKYAEKDGLADRFIQDVHAELKPTQLRRIFHQIKDMKREFHQEPASFNRGRIALLMPMLAYALGRDLIPQDFHDLMIFCFGPDKCRTVADFNNAADFLEAIMAYHKYHDKLSKRRKSKGE